MDPVEGGAVYVIGIENVGSGFGFAAVEVDGIMVFRSRSGGACAAPTGTCGCTAPMTTCVVFVGMAAPLILFLIRCIAATNDSFPIPAPLSIATSSLVINILDVPNLC